MAVNATASPPATTRHVLSAGARVFVRETGAGTPCLVVHGGLGLDHTYLRAMDALEDVCRLVYVDLPGNGRSERIPLETLTIARLVDALEDVREALGHERVLLLGHSYGAVLAMEYALRHPERTLGVILVGAPAGADFWDETTDHLRRRDPRLLAAFTSWPEPTDASFAAWLERALPAYTHGDGSDVAWMFDELVVDVRTWARGNAALAGWDILGRLRALHAPALVLHGRTDLVPVSQAFLLHEALPGARLVVFEQSGHFPYAEEPAAFFGAVREWLAERGL